MTSSHSPHPILSYLAPPQRRANPLDGAVQGVPSSRPFTSRYSTAHQANSSQLALKRPHSNAYTPELQRNHTCVPTAMQEQPPLHFAAAHPTAVAYQQVPFASGSQPTMLYMPGPSPPSAPPIESSPPGSAAVQLRLLFSETQALVKAFDTRLDGSLADLATDRKTLSQAQEQFLNDGRFAKTNELRTL